MIPPDPIVSAFDALPPDRVLVRRGATGATVGQVDAMAGELSRLVEARQAAEGGIVLVQVPNGPEFLAALVALRRGGRIAALVDAGTPEVELAALRERLGATATLRLESAWPDPTRFSLSAHAAPATPTHLAGAGVIKHTSSSTGQPRGVAVTSAALLADSETLLDAMDLQTEDAFVAALPLSFSYGLSSLAIPALTRGHTLVLPAGEGPYAPLRALTDARCGVFHTTPMFVQLMLRMAADTILPDTLKRLISAGAPLAPELAAAFRQRFGRAVHVFYGASESGGITYDREGNAAERGTVGTPLPGVDVTLEQDVVIVRSTAIALGYHPTPDPALDGQRFRTGDRASWSGPELRLTGRADRLLDVHGRMVDPSEVEAVLRSHPQVEDAVVTPGRNGVPQRLRAVLAVPEGQLEECDVLAWCRARLASHKVPRDVVVLEELPRTARGKLDRRALEGLGG